jgi:hypothetical protein
MIPLLGIFAAVVAIYSFHTVRGQVGQAWNPARGYLLCGCVLAWSGISISDERKSDAALLENHNLWLTLAMHIQRDSPSGAI